MSECLSDSTLKRHIDGKLSGDEAERIEVHLDDCAECDSRMNELLLRPRSDLPNRFKVKQHLGAGGYGDVYLCHDSLLKRLVGVKRLKPLKGSEDWLEEARNAAKVVHENVVQVFDVIEDPPCIVMEYIDGNNLATFLEECTPTSDTAAEIIKSIAEGVAAIHEQGLVHGDVKPKNILRSNEGRIVITDFGLSADLMRFSTEDLPAAGTIAYLAPEQIEFGFNNVSCSTDIYAIGAILYELLTAKPPFRGSKEELLERIPKGVSMMPQAICSTVPAQLESICLKAMSKSVEQRYESAAEIFAAVESYQSKQKFRRVILTSWTATALAVASVAIWLAVAYFFEQPPEPLIRELATTKDQVSDVKEQLDAEPFQRLVGSVELADSLYVGRYYEQCQNELRSIRERVGVELRSARIERHVRTLQSAVDRIGGVESVAAHFQTVEGKVTAVLKHNEESGGKMTEAELADTVTDLLDFIDKRERLTAFQLGIACSFIFSVQDYDTIKSALRYQHRRPELSEYLAILNVDSDVVLNFHSTASSALASADKRFEAVFTLPRDDINAKWGARTGGCFVLAWNLVAMVHRPRVGKSNAAQTIQLDGQIESAGFQEPTTDELRRYVSKVLELKDIKEFPVAEFFDFVTAIEATDFESLDNAAPNRK